MTTTYMPTADADARDQVLRAVRDPRWDFRTVNGIARQTGLSEDVVADALGQLLSDGAVRRSDVPDRHGHSLFTPGQRPVGFLEQIALIRNFLAKSAD
jgi:hypothetical protein